MLRADVLGVPADMRGAGDVRGADVRPHPRPYVPQPHGPRGPRQGWPAQGPEERRQDSARRQESASAALHPSHRQLPGHGGFAHIS